MIKSIISYLQEHALCVLILSGILVIILLYVLPDWTARGVIISLIFGLFGLYLNIKQRRIENSKLILTEIDHFFNRAFELIKETNNSINWNLAAINLQKSQELAENLTENAHKIIYQQYLLNTQFAFSERLQSIRKPSFFYGLPNWEELDLNQAKDEYEKKT